MWGLLEVGGGDGCLLAGIVTEITRRGQVVPPLAVVERSAAQRQRQVERLASLGVSARAAASPSELFRGLAGAMDGGANSVPKKGPVAAKLPTHWLVFSNELPDAFPARQLVWWQGDWREVWLRFSPTGLAAEEFRDFDDALDVEVPSCPREGQRVFLHPSYRDWLQQQWSELRAGLVVTIDYGRRAPSGECRAYQSHQRLEGVAVYEEPGQRDLTCDVNFTDLRRWGEQLGWRTTFDDLLCAFLEVWAPPEATVAEGTSGSLTPGGDGVAPGGNGEAPCPGPVPLEVEAATDRRFRDPFDVGGAFRVLIQEVASRWPG